MSHPLHGPCLSNGHHSNVILIYQHDFDVMRTRRDLHEGIDRLCTLSHDL